MSLEGDLYNLLVTAGFPCSLLTPSLWDLCNQEIPSLPAPVFSQERLRGRCQGLSYLVLPHGHVLPQV